MDTVRINEKDNVAVDLETGHKVALTNINEGEDVTKYGYPIGVATADIAKGEHVHSHNMKTNLEGELEYTYNPKLAFPEKRAPRTFTGFHRHDGKVGIRNEIWIIPTVGCGSDVANALVKEIRAPLVAE